MPELAETPMDLTALRAFQGLHLEQYFGLWAMEPESMRGLIDGFRAFDATAHVRAMQSSGEGADRMRVDARRHGAGNGRPTDGDSYTAVIPITGTLTKYGGSMSGPGAVAYKKAIRDVARDPDCVAIVLQIDSPGGTVAYIDELAQEVRRARESKQVIAVCEDLCASAAYWVASQATEIVVNSETARVGSIGVFMALADMSKAADKEGVRVIVVKAGQFKGMGVPGTEVTEEHMEYLQTMVDGVYENFLGAVSKGRGISLERARGWADGRVHDGNTAVAMGLADRIETLDEVLQRVATSARKPRGVSAVSTENTEPKAETPKAASAKRLREMFPKANESFRLACLESELTEAQASERWTEHLAAENERLEAALSAKESEPRADEKKPAGFSGVPYGGTGGGSSVEDSGDAIEMFESAVARKMATGMERQKAHAAVCREQPELREAMVAAKNQLARA